MSSSSTGLSHWVRQCVALTKKAFLIRARSWQMNLLFLTQSVFIIFLIWLVNLSMNLSSNQFTGAREDRQPAAVTVGSIPDCRTNIFLQADLPCYSVVYTPSGDPTVDAIMARVAGNNDPPLPRALFRSLSGQSESDAYLRTNPMTVLSAVHFRPINSQAWSYVLQTNDSANYFRGAFQDPNTYIQLPLQVAVEREFTRLALNASQLGWRVATRDFPHPSLTVASAVGSVAPVFILASLMINLVLLLQTVVAERESGLRGVMTSMGLMDSAYWISVLLPEMLVSAIHAALLTALSIAFRFDLALHNAPILLFLLLFLSSLALTSFALLLAVPMRRSAAAVPVSLVVFIVAWVFMLVQTFGLPFNGKSSTGLVVLWSLFPWSLLAKGLLDLAKATTGTKAGISWAERGSYCYADPPSLEDQARLPYWTANCSMPLAEGLVILLIQAAAYLALALYLDGVFPREDGGSTRPWLYPFLPSTWTLPKGGRHKVVKTKYAKEALVKAEHAGVDEGIDPDVAAEAQHTQQLCHSFLVNHTHPPPPVAAHLSDPLSVVTTHAQLLDGREGPVGGGRRAAKPSGLTPGGGVSSSSPSHRAGYRDSGDQGVVQHLTASADPPDWTNPAVFMRAHSDPNLHPPPPSQPTHTFTSGSGSSTLALSGSSHLGLTGPPSLALSDGTSFSLPPGVHLFGLCKVYWKGLMPGSAQEWSEWINSSLRVMVRPWTWLAVVRTWWADRQEAGQLKAVRDMWLSLVPGQCFCLLGPNGAGKTTTIKCLLGAVTASSGDAVVWGHSIRTAAGLAGVRAITGVCPQFDVLWPELTGMEHLQLFAHIKNLPTDSMQQQMELLLARVNLSKAARVAAGSYSGGMRRRLSLAIALLGDPLLLVLDEPTTGLDPVSRRQVWSLLTEAKAGRCMLLTTHAMEEADCLGDRIGIVVGGALRCLGNGLRLKAKYGDGVRLAVGLRTAAVAPADVPSVDLATLQGVTSMDDEASSSGTHNEATISDFKGRGRATDSGAADPPTRQQNNQVANGSGHQPVSDQASTAPGHGASSSHADGSSGTTCCSLPARTAALRRLVAAHLQAGPAGGRAMSHGHTIHSISEGAESASTGSNAWPERNGRLEENGEDEAVAHEGQDGLEGVGPKVAGQTGEGSSGTVRPQTDPHRIAVAPAAVQFQRFVVPHAQDHALLGLLEALQEKEEELGIVDVQVGLTPMEEIFHTVVQHS